MPPYDQPPPNKPLGPQPRRGFGLNAAQAAPTPPPSPGFGGTYPPELQEVNPAAEPSPSAAPTPAVRGATDREDVNALLGQQPETGFLQPGPSPVSTPPPTAQGQGPSPQPGSPVGPPPAGFNIMDLVGGARPPAQTRPLTNPNQGSYPQY